MRQRTFLTFGEQPFSPFTALARELNRELDKELYHNRELPHSFETEEAYLVSVDIPGVNFSDINIEMEDNRLMISAERTNPFNKNGEVFKKYNQTLTLPKNIDDSKINANYENGVLSLTLPKKADNKSKKKIEVVTGQKPSYWSNLLNLKKDEPKTAIN